jgi:hypothetical protein
MSDPVIQINGQTLNQAQALTLRVALGSFLADLSREDELGADWVGQGIRAGYLARGSEVQQMLQQNDHLVVLQQRKPLEKPLISEYLED